MLARITQLLLVIELGFAALIAIALNQWHQTTLPVAILAGVLAIIVVRSVILIYGFAVNYPYRTRQPTLPKLGILKLIRLIATECAIVLWSTSWRMPFRRFDKRITPNSTSVPVLLLHGYVCNSGFWRPMSRLLRRHGISHYAIDIEPVFGSIDASAASVHAALERIVAECGHERVVIIAHSMGGLVARAYLRDYGLHRIAKVITLGTPHHGTTVARRGIGACCKEMLCTLVSGNIVESDWLQKLAVCENKETRERFISIYSTHDNVIYPQSSSYLEGATNIAVTGTGHMELSVQREVQLRIINEITSTTA